MQWLRPFNGSDGLARRSDALTVEGSKVGDEWPEKLLSDPTAILASSSGEHY